VRSARALSYYGGLAALAALLLWLVVPFGPFPLAVPFDYSGDGLFFTALVKGIAEEGPLRLTRIGAPFGADIVDWPLGMWLVFGVTSALSRLLEQPGAVINVAWLLAIVASGLSAAWALRRLEVPAATAFVFGLLYAFLPYGFYRNVTHFGTFFPFVPLVALLALRIAGDAPERQDARERWQTLAGCLAQGLSYVYYAFFGCFLLAAAGAIGWARTRRLRSLRLAAAGMGLLALGAAIPLVPSAAYWSRHGRNTLLGYKQVADADSYGLKIRQLLVPIEGHPLAPLRRAEERIAQAHFPNENEGSTARLGLVGSIGFLALLALTLGGAASGQAAPSGLGPAGALTLAALLLGQVGGLGSLFSVFVSPDIRGYNRIVVYIAFFAFCAAARLFSRATQGLPPGAPGQLARGGALALVLGFGIVDQVPRQYLSAVRSAFAPQFAEDASFVAFAERRLPAGAMVFQLPHGTIPLDLSWRPPMNPYDPARAYLHSRSLRWSWGSILGRDGDWQAAVARLPPPLLARRVALAGFSAIWIDRWGFTTAPRPAWQQLEAALGVASGTAAVASPQGRYSLLDLEPLRARLRTQLGATAYEAAADRARERVDMLFPLWREGCVEEPAEGGNGPAELCGPSAWLVFKNDDNRERRFVISGRLQALAPGRLSITSGETREDLVLGAETVDFEWEVTMPAARKVRVDFAFEGACPAGTTAPRCLRVLGLTAVARDAAPAPGPAPSALEAR
jgi:hypothetical protein